MGGCLSFFGGCCVFSKRHASHDNRSPNFFSDKYSATSPLNSRIPLRDMSQKSKTASTASGATTHEWSSDSQMNEIRAFQKSAENKQSGSLINLISKKIHT